MHQPKVLVVGSANIDLVTRVPRVPRPGQTLLGSSFTVVPGGKGANQAVAAARLGAKTYFAGCVGDDAFGALLRENLARAGVDVSWLKAHPSEPTGTAVICVADEGENTIIVTPSANATVSADDVAALELVFREVDAVLFQFEIPLDTIEAGLDMANRTDTLVVLDAGAAQQVPTAILEKADIVSPNETEAEAMTGIPVSSVESAGTAARKLREMGARHVVVKLGANGSLYEGDESLHTPAFPADVVDTVAAGDAFTAALAVWWRRAPRDEVLIRANAAGALATTVAGAQPSMPTAAAVDAFLQKHGTQFNGQ